MADRRRGEGADRTHGEMGRRGHSERLASGEILMQMLI